MHKYCGYLESYLAITNIDTDKYILLGEAL